MSLTTNADESVTLTEKRSHVCIEAAWGLEALAELLPTVTDTHVCLKSGYKVRAIAARINSLAGIIMSGLGDEVATTDDLERNLKVFG